MEEKQAKVEALFLCEGHRKPLRVVTGARAVAGYGLEGDRHASDKPQRDTRQVLLMDSETLEAFGLEPGAVRENVTLRGVHVQSLLPGQRISLGGHAVLEITESCAPCERMDEVRPGLRAALEGRRGMLARVVEDGWIAVGDHVRPLATAAQRAGA